MSLTTSEIIGRVSLPNNVPLAGSIIEFRLSGFDTQGVNLIPGLSDADFILDADGNIPAGSRLWRNGQGLRGTRYSVSVRSPDYAIPYYSFHLGEVVVGPLPSYLLGDLLMAGSEQGKRRVAVSGGQISYFSRNGISFTQVLFRSSGLLSVEGAALPSVSYALGAGGASSANGWNRGGGGGGDVQPFRGVILPVGVLDISIGAGGVPGALTGSPSTLSGTISLTVEPGGRGAGGAQAAGTGANGGGGSQSAPPGVGSKHTGGSSGGGTRAGGGAGAGGDGQDSTPTAPAKAGDGGVGVFLEFMEPPRSVGGGGGGSAHDGSEAAQGKGKDGGTDGVQRGLSQDADWCGGAGGVREFGTGNTPGRGGDGMFVIVYPTYMAETEMAA